MAQDTFRKAITNLVNELGIEGTIKFYQDTGFGWSRKQIIHLIKVNVYPLVR